MKQLSNKTVSMSIIERAYDSQEECDNDEILMKEMGYQVVPDTHEIYEFFMRYIKHN